MPLSHYFFIGIFATIVCSEIVSNDDEFAITDFRHQVSNLAHLANFLSFENNFLNGKVQLMDLTRHYLNRNIDTRNVREFGGREPSANGVKEQNDMLALIDNSRAYDDYSKEINDLFKEYESFISSGVKNDENALNDPKLEQYVKMITKYKDQNLPRKGALNYAKLVDEYAPKFINHFESLHKLVPTRIDTFNWTTVNAVKMWYIKNNRNLEGLKAMRDYHDEYLRFTFSSGFNPTEFNEFDAAPLRNLVDIAQKNSHASRISTIFKGVEHIEKFKPAINDLKLLTNNSKNIKSLFSSIQETITAITSIEPFQDALLEEALKDQRKISDEFTLGNIPDSVNNIFGSFNSFVTPKFLKVIKKYEQLLDSTKTILPNIHMPKSLSTYLEKIHNIEKELGGKSLFEKLQPIVNCINKLNEKSNAAEILNEKLKYAESLENRTIVPIKFYKMAFRWSNISDELIKAISAPSMKNIHQTVNDTIWKMNYTEVLEFINLSRGNSSGSVSLLEASINDMNHLIATYDIPGLQKAINEAKQSIRNEIRSMVQCSESVSRNITEIRKLLEHIGLIWDKEPLKDFSIAIGAVQLFQKINKFEQKMMNVNDWLDDKWEEMKGRFGQFGMNASQIQTVKNGVEALNGVLELRNIWSSIKWLNSDVLEKTNAPEVANLLKTLKTVLFEYIQKLQNALTTGRSLLEHPGLGTDIAEIPITIPDFKLLTDYFDKTYNGGKKHVIRAALLKLTKFEAEHENYKKRLKELSVAVKTMSEWLSNEKKKITKEKVWCDCDKMASYDDDKCVKQCSPPA
uniref:Domain of unknown function WSN domain-containing protein n=1 Tax=Caenorhabditis japonica TaxID=281687 RepID=A0A8R1E389_CAEJA